MVAEAMDTYRGRIVAHLLCLVRSLRQGRMESLGFFWAGIRRNVRSLVRDAWHTHRVKIAH
jgi:hypothetical protein